MNATTHETMFLRRGLVALAAAAVLAALALPGCSEQPPAQTAAAPAASMASPTKVSRTEPENLGSIHIDDEIAKACDIPIAHFAFDSSDITGQAAQALDKLASCLSEGTLAGRDLQIVGYADPRGTLDYNLGLGQRRAGSVAKFLEAHGLDSDRVETSSMGDLEATGTDEAGWALDRKVEISLAHDPAVVRPPEMSQSTRDGSQTAS